MSELVTPQPIGSCVHPVDATAHQLRSHTVGV